MGSNLTTEEKLSNFEKLPTDVIIHMALDLSLPDLISLCQTSKRFNRIVCDNNIYWLNRLIKEYNIDTDSIPIKYTSNKKYTAKEYYEHMVKYSNIPATGGLYHSISTNDLPLFKISLDRLSLDGEFPDIHRGYHKIISMDMIKYLVETYKLTPTTINLLLSMLDEGRSDIIHYLLDNDVDININDGYMLLISISLQDLDTVKYLISRGADIHVMDDYGLILALKNSSTTEDIVKLMIDNGAVIKERYINEINTYFMYNFGKTHLNIIKLLINSGMNLYSLDIGRFLLNAIIQLDIDLVKFLLDYGVVLNEQHILELNKHLKYGAQLEHPALIRLLIDSGMPLYSLDIDSVEKTFRIKF